MMEEGIIRFMDQYSSSETVSSGSRMPLSSASMAVSSFQIAFSSKPMVISSASMSKLVSSICLLMFPRLGNINFQSYLFPHPRPFLRQLPDVSHPPISLRSLHLKVFLSSCPNVQEGNSTDC